MDKDSLYSHKLTDILFHFIFSYIFYKYQYLCFIIDPKIALLIPILRHGEATTVPVRTLKASLASAASHALTRPMSPTLNGCTRLLLLMIIDYL